MYPFCNNVNYYFQVAGIKMAESFLNSLILNSPFATWCPLATGVFPLHHQQFKSLCSAISQWREIKGAVIEGTELQAQSSYIVGVDPFFISLVNLLLRNY